MSALPSHPAEEPELPREGVPGAARTASFSVDDLGVTVRADLRISGVVGEVRDLFAATPPTEQAALLEKVIIIGATTVATTAELSATDAARVKLAESATALVAAHDRLVEQHERREKEFSDRVDSLFQALRQQLSDSTTQEEQLRKQLKEGQEELVKAAKQLDVSRGDLERKALEAIAGVTEAQTKAKDEVIKGSEAALRKLLDRNDPTSAPSLIAGVMNKAATEMRETTSKNIAELVKELTAALGPDSPLIEKLAKIVLDGAEQEIKRVEQGVDRLRSDLIENRTRIECSPNLLGDTYETQVLELVGSGAGVHGWTVTPTGTVTGDHAASKKGDHLLTDENDTAIAAIEARARKNVSAREFYDGLLATAANRDVKIVVYMAKTVEDLPSGLGEFSRGRVPLHFKCLADGVYAIATVIDPTSPTVVERLAMVLWFVDRLRDQLPERGSEGDAVSRIAEALPYIQQTVARLSGFRAVKSGLTKTGTELQRVRTKVIELEAALAADLKLLEQILWGDDDDIADDAPAEPW
jgi:hypothetical protein